MEEVTTTDSLIHTSATQQTNDTSHTPAPATKPRFPTMAPATDEMLVVCPRGSGNFRRIREAIAAARPGALIRVLTGQYRESLEIDKSLTIKGEGPVMIFSKNKPAVRLHNVAVSFDGVSIVAVCDNKDNRVAALHASRSTVLLNNCMVMSKNCHALFLQNRCSAYAEETYFKTNANHLTALVQHSCDIELFRCAFEKNIAGSLRISRQSRAMLQECAFSAAGIGGVFIENSSAKIAACTFVGDEDSLGILAYKDADVLVRECQNLSRIGCLFAVFERSKGRIEDTALRNVAYYNVLVEESELAVQSCNFERSIIGLAAGRGARATLRDTTLAYNKQCGVALRNGQVTAIHSVITNNDVGAIAKEHSSLVAKGCDLRYNTRKTFDGESSSRIQAKRCLMR